MLVEETFEESIVNRLRRFVGDGDIENEFCEFNVVEDDVVVDNFGNDIEEMVDGRESFNLDDILRRTVLFGGGILLFLDELRPSSTSLALSSPELICERICRLDLVIFGLVFLSDSVIKFESFFNKTLRVLCVIGGALYPYSLSFRRNSESDKLSNEAMFRNVE